ncbi:MAG TPA: ATP synthase subunit C [Spirochaetota bacterium]|nr:ATP synthase subunit C [Spirochaetota bacterium]HPI90965.1 ATP synthase subunit C [Spirochaetota bacterium]HPR47324.1 ATP synthase subunit C [Spirochaetota bacterium]
MNYKKLIPWFLVIVAGTALMSFVPEAALYGEAAADAASAGMMTESNKTVIALTAMGAVGISCISSGYALARIGSAAMGAMSEKPEIGGRALVFLGMAEGIAIYGLIIAIMMLNKI